jgi:hypothetical protein
VDGQEPQAGSQGGVNPVFPALPGTLVTVFQEFHGNPKILSQHGQVAIDLVHQAFVQPGPANLDGRGDHIEIRDEGVLRDEVGMTDDTAGSIVFYGAVFGKPVLLCNLFEMQNGVFKTGALLAGERS